MKKFDESFFDTNTTDFPKYNLDEFLNNKELEYICKKEKQFYLENCYNLTRTTFCGKLEQALIACLKSNNII
jgi:hypothetical protein